MRLKAGDVTVAVDDLAEAKRFFVDALGLGVVAEQPNLLVLDAGARLAVERGKGGGRVELEASGLGDLVERLDDQGYYADGPKETPSGAYADIEGPSGLEIVIWEAK